MSRLVTARDDDLSMSEAAGRCNLSAERFRKVWRSWVRDLGFPGPYREPRVGVVGGHRCKTGGPNYAWRAGAIDDWKLAREAQACSAWTAPPSATGVPKPVNPRLARERAELRRLMRSA